jgi:hypothetical protein
MAYTFDDNTSFEEYDQFVFDWARDEDTNLPNVFRYRLIA